jgi:hypothetical protein
LISLLGLGWRELGRQERLAHNGKLAIGIRQTDPKGCEVRQKLQSPTESAYSFRAAARIGWQPRRLFYRGAGCHAFPFLEKMAIAPAAHLGEA